MFSIATGVTVLIAYDRMYRAAQEDARTNVARNIATISFALWNYDEGALDASLHALTQSGSIIRAEVRDLRQFVAFIPPPQPKTPVLTVGQKQRRIERLRKCIQRLEAFDPNKVQKRVGVPEVRTLEADIDKALCSAFGYGTARYLRYNLAAALDPGPLTADGALRPVQRPVGGPRRHAAQLEEARQKFSEGKERSITLLREAIGTLENDIAEAQPIMEPVKPQSIVESVPDSKDTQPAGEVRSLLPRLWGGIDLKAAWRRIVRWSRRRN